jgi:hypothetical protein
MPETKAAFARARELARQVDNAADRFSVYYGQWVSSFTRGEIGPAREMAELFLHDVEADQSLPEACVGHRVFASTCWYIGEFAKAHEHLQRALNLFDPKQHQDFMHRFGQDVGSQAGIFDALALTGSVTLTRLCTAPIRREKTLALQPMSRPWCNSTTGGSFLV